MPWEEDDYIEGFAAPLPPEDRLWRHPAEVAAAHRAATTVTTVRTPWRRAIALTLIGAAGGALVVSGLFLSLRGDSVATGRIIESMALDPVVPRPILVDADDWPAKVAELSTQGIATITATRNAHVYEGSGVTFRSAGLLLTSSNLVAYADHIMVTTKDHERYVGEVVGIDEVSGLAVVQIDESDLLVAHLGIFKPPLRLGQYAVVVAGSSSTGELEMTSITGLSVQVPLTPTSSLHGMVELSGGLPPGASGGAVVDDSGAVIAIAIDSGNENATHAVPIAYARKIAGDIVNHGGGRHPWMGIRGIDLGMDEQVDLGLTGGVEIRQVTGEPAEDAGLRPGDVLTELGDERVDSMTGLVLALRQHPPGKTLKVTFLRDGEWHASELTLQLRPDEHST